MGRQIMANLHRGFSKDREGKRGKEQEQRSEQQVSEDRWGDREQRNNIRISQERERGEERKEQEQRSEQQVSEDRWGDREWRTYIGIDIRKTSLKTDGETESRHLT